MDHGAGPDCPWAQRQALIATVSRTLLDRRRPVPESMDGALDVVLAELDLFGVGVFARVDGRIVVEGLRVRQPVEVPSFEGREVASVPWLARLLEAGSTGLTHLVVTPDELLPEWRTIIEKHAGAGAVVVAVPLWRGRDVTGILVAVDAAAREWHPADVNALAATARLVHTAGERHRAEEALHRRLERTTRRHREADLLSRVALRLLETLSDEVDEVVPEVLGLLTDHLGCTDATWLWRPRDGRRWESHPPGEPAFLGPDVRDRILEPTGVASVPGGDGVLVILPAALGDAEGRLVLAGAAGLDGADLELARRVADALAEFEEYVILDRRSALRALFAATRAEVTRHLAGDDTDADPGVSWTVERLAEVVAPARVALVSSETSAAGDDAVPHPVRAVHAAGDDPPSFLVVGGDLDPVAEPLVRELVAEIAVEIRRHRRACAARRELADEARLQRLVTEVSRTLIGDETLDERVARVLERVGETLDLLSCQLVEVDHDTRRLQVRSAWTASDALPVLGTVDVPDAVWPDLIRRLDAPVVVTPAEMVVGGAEYLAAGGPPDAPFLFVPTSRAGRLARILVLQGTSERVFGASETAACETLAATLHAAIVASRAHDLFAATFDASPIAQIVTRAGRLLAANRAFADLAGERPQPGAPVTELLDGLDPAVLGPGGDGERLVVVRGRRRWIRVHTAAGRWAGEAVTVASLEDVTDEVERARRLAHEAAHDALTGVGSRRALERLLEELDETAGGERSVGTDEGSERPSRAGVLLLLDLDRFKIVNDAVGHRVGDHLLQVTAQRLAGAVRRDDRVFRFGGDEFVVYLPDADTLEAIAVAARLRSAVEEPVELGEVGGEPGSVTPSCSIGLAPVRRADPTAALRHADAALAVAKTSGRARIEVFEPAHEERLAERLRLESELRAALAAGDLEPWYQPEIDLETGRIVAFEALVRWRRGDEILPAGAFIEVAEEMGLAPAISQRMLAAALVDLGRLPGVAVRVNVTASQLATGDLPALVAALLENHRLEPGRLGLEVTERSLLDRDAAVTAIGRLRELGVRVAVDDFGTGHSSLGWLKHLPVDTVKIDRAFVAEITSDVRDRALVTAVVELAD
ncbi:MAG: EAL domain-containing protein, partial [Actinomyces sp.]